MNTVASLPAKLLELADRIENLLTAWGESDEREDRDNIAAELREAAAALATPAVEGGLPEDAANTIRWLEAMAGHPAWKGSCGDSPKPQEFRDAAALVRRLATPEQPGSAVQGEAVRPGYRHVVHELLTNIKRTCERGRNAAQTESNMVATCDHIENLADEALGYLTTPPPAPAAEQGEAVELTKCCGREECGGECGNEWRGMEWVRKAQPEARGVEGLRQGNWHHPDGGRVVGWVIEPDDKDRMGADAFCLPCEIAEALTMLRDEHRASAPAAPVERSDKQRHKNAIRVLWSLGWRWNGEWIAPAAPVGVDEAQAEAIRARRHQIGGWLKALEQIASETSASTPTEAADRFQRIARAALAGKDGA